MNPDHTPLGPLTQSTTVHCPQQTPKKNPHGHSTTRADLYLDNMMLTPPSTKTQMAQR
jgi:hypothetical protein